MSTRPLTYIELKDMFVKDICQEFLTIYRICFTEAKKGKLKPDDYQQLINSVRDDFKAINKINTSFFSSVLANETSDENFSKGDFLEKVNEALGAVRTLIAGSPFMFSCFDAAYYFHLENQLSSRGEIEAIGDLITKTYDDLKRGPLSSALAVKIIVGCLTLGELQNAILTQLMQLSNE